MGLPDATSDANKRYPWRPGILAIIVLNAPYGIYISDPYALLEQIQWICLMRHLIPLGLNWTRLDSCELTWTRLDSLGNTSTWGFKQSIK